MQSASKVWLITGAARGFGRVWALAALERGDHVVATARNIRALDDLVEVCGPQAVLPLELDITDRQACFTAVDRACEWFGSLDVLVNNAGYGQLGFVEEVSEQQARAQFDTNVFGTLWLTQAALPVMRDQRRGHIIQVSSIGGITAFAGSGMYNASKWAVEGFSQALAWEVAPLGVRVTLVEPTSYTTDWLGAAQTAAPIEDYAGLHEVATQTIKKTLAVHHDPHAAASALLNLTDAADPPLRVLLGGDALAIAERDYSQRLASWRHWQPFASQMGV